MTLASTWLHACQHVALTCIYVHVLKVISIINTTQIVMIQLAFKELILLSLLLSLSFYKNR